MNEKRRFLREEIEFPANYELCETRLGFSFPCTVKDISYTGMRIETPVKNGFMHHYYQAMLKPRHYVFVAVGDAKILCKVVYIEPEKMGLCYDLVEPKKINKILDQVRGQYAR